VAQERTVIAMGDATDMLRGFARECALSVAHLWKASPLVLEYLRTGDMTLAAEAEALARSAWSAELARSASAELARSASAELAELARSASAARATLMVAQKETAEAQAWSVMSASSAYKEQPRNRFRELCFEFIQKAA